MGWSGLNNYLSLIPTKVPLEKDTTLYLNAREDLEALSSLYAGETSSHALPSMILISKEQYTVPGRCKHGKTVKKNLQAQKQLGVSNLRLVGRRSDVVLARVLARPVSNDFYE